MWLRGRACLAGRGVIMVRSKFHRVLSAWVGLGRAGLGLIGYLQLSQTEESLRQERIFINKINLVSGRRGVAVVWWDDWPAQEPF